MLDTEGDQRRTIVANKVLSVLRKESLLPRVKLKKKSEPLVCGNSLLTDRNVQAENKVVKEFTNEIIRKNVKQEVSFKGSLVKKNTFQKNCHGTIETCRNPSFLRLANPFTSETEELSSVATNNLQSEAMLGQFSCFLKRRTDGITKPNKSTAFFFKKHNRSKSVGRATNETKSGIHAIIQGRSVKHLNEPLPAVPTKNDQDLCKNIVEALTFFPYLTMKGNNDNRPFNARKSSEKFNAPSLIKFMLRNNFETEDPSTNFARDFKKKLISPLKGSEKKKIVPETTLKITSASSFALHTTRYHK